MCTHFISIKCTLSPCTYSTLYIIYCIQSQFQSRQMSVRATLSCFFFFCSVSSHFCLFSIFSQIDSFCFCFSFSPMQAPAPMAFPMTTPQVPVYGMVSQIDAQVHYINAEYTEVHTFFCLVLDVNFFIIFLYFTSFQVPPQMGQMGGVPVMAPQPMMYNQPVLRPTNPFAPMPGAQVTQWNLLPCLHSYTQNIITLLIT